MLEQRNYHDGDDDENVDEHVDDDTDNNEDDDGGAEDDDDDNDCYSSDNDYMTCLLYTSPSPRDGLLSRMPSSA